MHNIRPMFRGAGTRVRMRRTFTVVAGLLLAAGTALSHGDAEWIAKGNYKGKAGEQCCGDHDCHSLQPQSVQLVGATYHVAYDGRDYAIPDNQAHDSIDERYWICIWGGGMKCFFRPKLGS